MFNENSGYVGSSRSVRSRNAIKNYEMPLSMINRSIIQDLIDEYPEYESLRKVPVSIWKYASENDGASSWHHTGKYFNQTDHYDLLEIADMLSEKLDEITADYKEAKKAKKAEKQQLKKEATYCILEVQIWGGTRKHPKLLGTEYVAGLRIGNWMYSINGSKYKVDANKVVGQWDYQTYDEMVKKNKEFKSTKRKFNKIVKEKNL